MGEIFRMIDGSFVFFMDGYADSLPQVANFSCSY